MADQACGSCKWTDEHTSMTRSAAPCVAGWSSAAMAWRRANVRTSPALTINPSAPPCPGWRSMEKRAPRKRDEQLSLFAPSPSRRSP